MKNNYQPDYIKCPECSNILNLSFIDQTCPNPLCNFNFKGLQELINKNDSELHKLIKITPVSNSELKYKLLITAIKFNMFSYLKHFVECNWGAHYQTLYKDFIKLYLDDLNILKELLKSDCIKNKDNTIVSKNGYKMFWELYEYLIKVHNVEIRDFLRKEFPEFYRKWYRKLHRRKTPKTKSNQKQLI